MKLSEWGIVGIFCGRKSTFASIVLAISSVALFTHHLDSSTFGIVISVICSALFASHSYQTAQQMSYSQYPPGYNPNQPNMPYPPNENNSNPAKPLDVPQPPTGT